MNKTQTKSKVGEKKLKFKKDIYKINIPFMLTDFSPWQEQIDAELNRCKQRFIVRKSARWGFEITENGAMIICYKK